MLDEHPVAERGAARGPSADPSSAPGSSQEPAEDGLVLRVARWRPTARRTRGTVCILQGRAEFIERYFETITELRRRG